MGDVPTEGPDLPVQPGNGPRTHTWYKIQVHRIIIRRTHKWYLIQVYRIMTLRWGKCFLIHHIMAPR